MKEELVVCSPSEALFIRISAIILYNLFSTIASTHTPSQRNTHTEIVHTLNRKTFRNSGYPPSIPNRLIRHLVDCSQVIVQLVSSRKTISARAIASSYRASKQFAIFSAMCLVMPSQLVPSSEGSETPFWRHAAWFNAVKGFPVDEVSIGSVRREQDWKVRTLLPCTILETQESSRWCLLIARMALLPFLANGTFGLPHSRSKFGDTGSGGSWRRLQDRTVACWGHLSSADMLVTDLIEALGLSNVDSSRRRWCT